MAPARNHNRVDAYLNRNAVLKNARYLSEAKHQPFSADSVATTVIVSTPATQLTEGDKTPYALETHPEGEKGGHPWWCMGRSIEQRHRSQGNGMVSPSLCDIEFTAVGVRYEAMTSEGSPNERHANWR